MPNINRTSGPEVPQAKTAPSEQAYQLPNGDKIFIEPGSVKKDGERLSMRLGRDQTTQGANLPKGTIVTFKKSLLTEATLSKNHNVQGYNFSGGTRLEFDEDQKVTVAELAQPQKFRVQGQKEPKLFKAGSALFFNNQGQVKTVWLPEQSAKEGRQIINYYSDGTSKTTFMKKILGTA